MILHTTSQRDRGPDEESLQQMLGDDQGHQHATQQQRVGPQPCEDERGDLGLVGNEHQVPWRGAERQCHESPSRRSSRGLVDGSSSSASGNAAIASGRAAAMLGAVRSAGRERSHCRQAERRDRRRSRPGPAVDAAG